MCVFNGKADASDTIVYGGFADDGGEHWQVTGYQCTVQNLVGAPPQPSIGGGRRQLPDFRFLPEPYDKGNDGGGNMMIIPVPALPGMMRPMDFFDTQHTPRILQDMVEALTTGTMTRSPSFGMEPMRGQMTVFEHGIFHIAMSHIVTPDGLAEALSRIPARKVPRQLNWPTLMKYPDMYPMWTLIFACFDNRDAIRATPLFYRYRPMPEWSNRVFMPALDSHTGQPPVPGELVNVDHTLVLAHPNGAPVRYRDDVRALGPYLPNRVVGLRLKGTRLENGDFIGDCTTLGDDYINVERTNSSGKLELAATPEIF